MHIDGGCHCGALTYEAEIDPARVGVCHCLDCQILSGSAFRTAVTALVPDRPLLYYLFSLQPPASAVDGALL